MLIKTDIWCYFFLDDSDELFIQKLKDIRALIIYSGDEDIQIYNYWARKYGVPEIK